MPKIVTLFIEILPELYKAIKLIIDLRNNGGDSTNIGRDILQFLTTYPDGKLFVGYGIVPDIEIKKTVSDYINEQDPALVAAIQFLNKN